MTRHLLSPCLAALLVAAAPALAHGPVPPRPAAADQAAFERDRAAILAMAGDYKVTFDMRETTAWRPDYTPIPAKTSGGHESVRVIEDTGRHIKLQHLLVVDMDGKPTVIKHWRQDWTFEPEQVLTYAGPNRWTLETVPERMRRGRWAQTVWQTDDSPRYGGWGEWSDEGGVRRWRSNWTWRPLARRDAIRKPVYDRYYGINRHSPTPDGWIHWQDNMKMAAGPDGKPMPYVQESVLNTYTKFNGYPVAEAERYWTATKGYWSAVRSQWDAAIARGQGVTVQEEADAGAVTGPRLMGLADEVAEGKLSEAAAVARARDVIIQAAKGPASKD